MQPIKVILYIIHLLSIIFCFTLIRIAFIYCLILIFLFLFKFFEKGIDCHLFILNKKNLSISRLQRQKLRIHYGRVIL